MNKKLTLILILIIIVLALFGYYLYQRSLVITPNQSGEGTLSKIFSFSPFGRKDVDTTQNTGGTTTDNSKDIPVDTDQKEVVTPKLRKISTFPVGGFFATSSSIQKESAQIGTTSTQNQTEIISVSRFIDRGTGHVYESKSDSLSIKKISNTTLPMIVESFWTKEGTSFIARYMEGDEVVNFYTELKEREVIPSSSTSASTDQENSEMLYELRGRSAWIDANSFVLSPDKSQIFVWVKQGSFGGVSEGYTGNLGETSKSKVVDLPYNDFNMDWPNKDSIFLTTKGTAYGSGVSYLLNIKSGILEKVVPSTRGLSALISHDLETVFISKTRSNTFESNFVDIKTSQILDSVFRTIPSKCVWSKLRTKEIYCAIPTEIPEGEYPDDWYKGKISFNDQIWHLDRETGSVHLLSNPLKEANESLDIYKMMLDPREDFLYFINKKDLTLWALDLTK